MWSQSLYLGARVCSKIYEPESLLGTQNVEPESVLWSQGVEPEFGSRVCTW